MSDGSGDREALDTARDLVATMKALTAEVKGLRSYGRHNRWFVMFDIALTVLLGISGAISVHAVDVASAAGVAAQRNAATVQDVHDANLKSCRLGNIRLARQKRVLNGILRTPPNATAAHRAYLAHARAQIALGWAPRNCVQVYQIGRP